MKNNFPITYVMHCKKLKERKEELDKWIHKIPRTPIFTTDYDADELNEQIINKYYNNDEEIQKKFAGNTLSLNKNKISLAIKHIKTIEKFLESGEEIALFLEDDVIPIENAIDEIKECLVNTPRDMDMIFIGQGVGKKFIEDKLKESVKINDKCYKTKTSNCTEAYLIHKKAAKKLICKIIPFHFPIDWELFYQFSNDEYNVYWWIPPIFEQGSKNGKFESSLDYNEK